ncbi:MAG: Ni,Fe-hydrogenase III large subunit [Thermoplasmata archaeon]
MKYFKFNVKDGYYIGETKNFSVYENGILGRNEPIEISQNMSKIVDKNHFTFQYGPATGGLIEPLDFKIITNGETIKGIFADPYVKSRTMRCLNKKIDECLLLVERINGYHSANHSIAFLTAIEDALNLEISEGTYYGRIVILELERIRSHLLVLKRVCEPAGFGVPMYQLSYINEKISRIISDISGHRYFFSTNELNKVKIDFGLLSSYIQSLIGIKREFEKIFNDLLESKIFINRLQGNGIIKEEPLIGPAARAAGIKRDARIGLSGLPYRELNFEPVTFNEGDSFGRFYIRGQEILQSFDLCINGLERARQNDYSYNINNESSGSGAGRLESPSGDLFYYIDIDRGRIRNIEMSSPSYLNLKTFTKSAINNIFTDFHFNFESFGIWVSEMGVEFI